MEETTSVAKAIINNSRILNPKKKPVVDKHSIGGIAGNRITPIMIPVLAAAGLTIPKPAPGPESLNLQMSITR